MLAKLFSRKKATERSNKALFITMLVFGSLGLIAAFALSVERVEQLINPDAQLICNFNLLFNCGIVMKTPQSHVFGFPNSFIGLMGFSVVVTVAVVGLAKAKLPRWFWFVAQIGYGLGLIFAYWLFYNSVFDIQVLCPWCLLVTFSTTMLFETLLHYNLRENNLFLSKDLHKKVTSFLDKDYDKFITAVWLAANIFLVLFIFRSSIF
jgi:uncharacterized membrane protein